METLISIKAPFEKSFQMYKPRALVMGALMVVPLLVAMVGAVFLAPLLIFVPLSGFDIGTILFGALLVLVVVLLGLIIYFLSHIALFYCLREENAPINVQSIKDLLSKSLKVVGSYAWACLISGLVVVLGFILLVIPGIIFSIWFSFVSYVVIFEGLRGMGALKQSKSLVKGYWWPVFGRMIIMILAAIGVSIIPIIGDAISFLCVTPFCVIYMYLMYEDLKRIKGIAV